MENIEEVCVFRYSPYDEYSPLSFFIFGKEDTYYEVLVNNQKERILQCGKPKVCPYFQEIIDHLNSFLPEGRKLDVNVTYRIDNDFIEIVNNIEKFTFEDLDDRDIDGPLCYERESDDDEPEYGRWYHDEE